MLRIYKLSINKQLFLNQQQTRNLNGGYSLYKSTLEARQQPKIEIMWDIQNIISIYLINVYSCLNHTLPSG